MPRRPLVALTLLLWLAATSASAYELLGQRWQVDNGPIAYHLHPDGSADVEDGSDLEAVRNAFRTWSCVEGQALRFVEGEEPGVRAFEDDGVDSVYWDENNDHGFGPATYATTRTRPGSDDGGEFLPTESADMVFNGFDHFWSTDAARVSGGSEDLVDIESVAVHEVGHWLGLDHPCEDTENKTGCLPLEESRMTPSSQNSDVARDLRPDDEAGIRFLYPADDGSRCDGPYRFREPCTCNDDCVDGLVCAEVAQGEQVCTHACSLDNLDVCAPGFACALSPGPGAVVGLCVRVSDTGQSPAGAQCENDRQCQDEALCALAEPIGRTVCRIQCEVAADCPGGTTCTEGVCTVLEPGGIVCPSDEPPPEPCACAVAGAGAPPSQWLIALGLLAFTALRRRESRNRRRARPLR